MCAATRDLLAHQFFITAVVVREDPALGAEVPRGARDAVVPRAGAGRGSAENQGDAGNESSACAHLVRG